MSPVDIDTALQWRGRAVVDRDGEKIGKLRDIYLDEQDQPSWASVHTGLFGGRETFVPLRDAEPVDDQLRLPYTRAQVEEAPNLDPDVQLSPEEEERLYRHYGADDAPQGGGDDDAAMIRSEEEVEIGKRTRVRGKARLKKYVVTDYVEKRVPVKREEVRVEYDPPADAPRDQ